jgi:dipeptidyl aminopeptidase/acylaminoacyl peptidase
MSEQTEQTDWHESPNQSAPAHVAGPAIEEEITAQQPVQKVEEDNATRQEPTMVHPEPENASELAINDEQGDATVAMPIEAPVSEAGTIQVPALPIEPAGDAIIATPAPAATPAVTPASAAVDTPVRVAPAQAATRSFMSPADLLELRLASEPQVSPDGLLVAYTLLTSDLEKQTTSMTIWLVPAIAPNAGGKGQPPRQLTIGTSNAHVPRWSPDGRSLAFLSDRAGSEQVYILPLNGGEARQVSFLKESVSNFSWRPDGRALLLESPWKSADDHPDGVSEELVQVWTRLDETWDGSGYKHGRHTHLWLLHLEDEQPAQRLTSDPMDHVQACWSPDGSEIAFCSNRRAAPDLSVSAALWVLTLATSRMRRLSPSEGLAKQPSWSPDGKWLAFYFAAEQNEAVNIVPWVVEASGQSAPRPATSISQTQTSIETIVDNLHLYDISRPGWYPDSTSLMVTVQARGQVHLNRLYINTNHEEPLTTGNGCYLSPHLSANGRTIVALRTDWFTPGDIWALAGNGLNPRRLSAVNDTLMRSRQVIRPKKVGWRSFDNQEIEGWLYLPPLPPGQRAPLVLDVHGGPTLAWAESYVHDFQVLAGLGYAVLVANPRGSAGYGEAFCRKVINDWGGDDLRDLMLGLDHIIATEPVDGSRLAITGASYGGYMTCWAITREQRFKAAVARNPVTSLLTSGSLSDQWLWFDLIMGTAEAGQDAETLRRSRSPLTFADAITTPLLLIHATDDLRCPPGESKQLFNALRRRQQTVELALYPGASHLLDFPGIGTPSQRVDRLQRSVAWFQKYV